MEDALDKFINKNSDKVEEYQAIIGRMMSDDRTYGFAHSTLSGIYDAIEETGTITDGQIRAVDNIKKSVKNRSPYY